MLIGLIILPCASLFALACGDSDSAPAPPPLSTGARPTPPPDAGSTEHDALVLTPTTPTSTTYTGSLAATSTVPFGGSGYCNYEMTLRDVTMEIEVLANGDVGQAIVRDLAVEKALTGCPYPPMDPSIQEFSVKSSAVTTTGTRIEFVGAKDNHPETSLVVDLVQAGAGYEATPTWKRTDQGPPLSWTVSAKMNLVRK